MKLIYTGDFERLKDFGFELDDKEWFVYYDKENNTYVYILPISKELKFGVNSTTIKFVPITIYDLIQAGLVKKEEEDK